MASLNYDCLIFNAPRNEIDIEIVIKKSRFIGSVRLALSESEASAKIKEISTNYPGATHYCWAYRIGTDYIQEHSSDDGEPSGTAGRPILGVLKKYLLENTVLVVTRYYGGVKLGVRGLIDAYAETAEETLKKAGSREMESHNLLQLSCGYDHSKTMTHTLQQLGLATERISINYAADVAFEIEVPCSLREEITAVVDEMKARGFLNQLLWHDETLIREREKEQRG